jgi:hypothetical protein
MGRTSTRRTLIGGGSFLLGLALNVIILVLIARFDAPVPQDDTPVPQVVPVDLSQLVLPDRTAVLIARKPPILAKRRAGPAPAAGSPSHLQPSPPTAPAAELESHNAPLAAPAALGDPDAATRAKVSAALRGLTGCSMISAPDDEVTRDRCHSAFTKADVAGVAIDSVPSEKRAAYDVSALQAEHVRAATIDVLKPETAGHSMVRDRGVSISVHYKCVMKFGAGAVPRMHCPGIM